MHTPPRVAQVRAGAEMRPQKRHPTSRGAPALARHPTPMYGPARACGLGMAEPVHVDVVESCEWGRG